MDLHFGDAQLIKDKFVDPAVFPLYSGSIVVIQAAQGFAVQKRQGNRIKFPGSHEPGMPEAHFGSSPVQDFPLHLDRYIFPMTNGGIGNHPDPFGIGQGRDAEVITKVPDKGTSVFSLFFVIMGIQPGQCFATQEIKAYRAKIPVIQQPWTLQMTFLRGPVQNVLCDISRYPVPQSPGIRLTQNPYPLCGIHGRDACQTAEILNGIPVRFLCSRTVMIVQADERFIIQEAAGFCQIFVF